MFVNYDYSFPKGGIRIIDSDFQDMFYDPDGTSTKFTIVKAVIHIYEKRNINVGANLALALKQTQRYNNRYSMNALISSCLEEVKEYAKYKDDVEKYLLLM